VEVQSRIPARVLFIIATVFGVSSTVQAYWIGRLSNDHDWHAHNVAQLLVLNLTYWYVPALLAPLIMSVATRYRLGRASFGTLALVHVPGALVYAGIHELVMVAVRFAIVPGGSVRTGCWRCVVRDSLQQLDWLLMTYLFFVGLAHALAYRRAFEAQELNAAQLETRLVEAQLQSLQRQLQPHFLFNTLNTISGLMRSNMDAADRMIDQLGDLLRMTLNTSGAEQVPLQEELEMLQKYLEIEQTRFGGRLTIKTDIEPETLDALVPYMLLQPLAENAIRHGVAPHARPGWVAIHTAHVGDQLEIEIRDSGNGLPPDRLDQLNQGVGLSNTRARLAHLYPDAFTFRFSNMVEGFCVTVAVPFKEYPAANAKAGAA
jgi:signal transduction histidine kinase